MVWVHSSNTGSPSCLEYLRFRRWAERVMGVRGFFTSWAIRRATSRQAAIRWPFSNSVKSSKTITIPICWPVSSLKALTVIKKLRGLPSMISFKGTSMMDASRARDRLPIISSARSLFWTVRILLKLLFRTSSALTPSMFSADLLMVETIPLASRVTTPAETLLRTNSIYWRLSSISMF